MSMADLIIIPLESFYNKLYTRQTKYWGGGAIWRIFISYKMGFYFNYNSTDNYTNISLNYLFV